MKTLFEVIDYNVDRDCNLLFVALSTENNCYIPLRKFERWLDRTDRLDWVHDWSDQNGDHCQETGRYKISQYWEMSSRQIHQDIYEFIVIHFVDPFQGIIDSITEITNEHARKQATNVV